MTLDTSGRACPEPVLMVRDALKENPDGIRVIANTRVSAANILRFATNQRYKVDTAEQDGVYTMEIRR